MAQLTIEARFICWFWKALKTSESSADTWDSFRRSFHTVCTRRAAFGDLRIPLAQNARRQKRKWQCEASFEVPRWH